LKNEVTMLTGSFRFLQQTSIDTFYNEELDTMHSLY